MMQTRQTTHMDREEQEEERDHHHHSAMYCIVSLALFISHQFQSAPCYTLPIFCSYTTTPIGMNMLFVARLVLVLVC